MTSDIIKNKNKRARESRNRREQELRDMRVESAYRYSLHDSMKLIDLMLDDDSVRAVEVQIPKKHLSQFLKAIYFEEMADYTIVQLDADKFSIGRKVINF